MRLKVIVELFSVLKLQMSSAYTRFLGSATKQSISSYSSSSSGVGPLSLSSNTSLLCAEAVLRLLTVIKTLGRDDGQFRLQYTKVIIGEAYFDAQITN